MKNLKISLTTILTAILLTISTGVYAYSGLDVDTKYEISMPGNLSNGTGTVSTSVSGDMKYQFVEISQEKYAILKKYEAQLELMQAYVKGEFANWEDSQANAEYEALVSKYESAYGEKVSELYTTYVNFDSNSIATVRSLWIHELPDYTENWQNSSDKKISIDLTTFTGTKYYVSWIKLGNVFDAEAYIITGTGNTNKQDEPKDPDQPSNNQPSNNQPNNNQPNNNQNKDNNNGIVNSNKKDTTASSSGKVLPKTGVSSTILGLIALAGTSAGISYRKYRKIK